MVRTILHIVFVLGFLLPATAQQPTYNFHKLGVNDGLHDGIIRCIGQDKFGYIWMGSVGGLNRFDGKYVRQFTYDRTDTNSPYPSQPRTILSDRKGKLWISFVEGLMEFDFNREAFRRIPSTQGVTIQKMIPYSDSILFLATNQGLGKLNTQTEKLILYKHSADTLQQKWLGGGTVDIDLQDDCIYLPAKSTLVKFHVSKGRIELLTFNDPAIQHIRHVKVDRSHQLWLATQGQSILYKYDPVSQTLKNYSQFTSTEFSTQSYNLRGILEDVHGTLWVITGVDGLLRYNPRTDAFIAIKHDHKLPASPSGNNYRSLFEDREGMIWLGGDFNGVDYFDPKPNLFETIFGYEDNLNVRQRIVGRGFAQDQQGNYWMGSHDGISRYQPATQRYTYWHNDGVHANAIYHNVIRSIYCDRNNRVWFGTGSGVNRYNSNTGIMEFISPADLPTSFYNTITADSSGNIWFGTNDSLGLYWYNVKEEKFYGVNKHPVLKKYKGLTVSYVMEDSRHRLWISYGNLGGLVMYDKTQGTTKQFFRKTPDQRTIIGNQVIDIKEDRAGVIWVTTFNGITGINPDTDSFLSFNNRNGLIGNMTSCLAIDRFNRIWIGVTGGLQMLNAERNHFTLFTEQEGISSVQFPEHAGVILPNQDIVFATNNGFLKFSPEAYQETKHTLSFYIRSFSIFNQEFFTLREADNQARIDCKADQNAITFNLVAVNFRNPLNTWFAYRLEGFEKEWHYTQDARAVYTNLSGGNYTFQYKASNQNGHWNAVSAKSVFLHIDTLFYKSTWFWLAVLVITLSLLAYIYRYRVKQQTEVFSLKEKAQVLEKEKAQVMYENLKQHLNPHFLFNSLTSLSSLIRIDQSLASNFLDKMSKVYRYVLKNRDNELVPLAEELKFVQLYIDLQQTRFAKGLIIDIRLTPDDGQYKIAPVTLQNLVENAIKHNTADPEQPLQIALFIEEDYLIVQNNIQKKKFVETSNMQGLASMKSLYRYLSDRPMHVLEDEHYFTVKIPLV
jgi:ligand-binding sensor domain-containing protein